MEKKTQSKRLSSQHKESKGAVGIFGDEAKEHDEEVSKLSQVVVKILEKKYKKKLEFRYRKKLLKKEINEALQKIDCDLGKTLYVKGSHIKPDGGIIEVKDDNGNWRVVLVSEAKRQGKDIENVKHGKKVGKNNDEDLMTAGCAIERAYKNISEIANFMLNEIYFPYVIFLDGSNFLTKNFTVMCSDEKSIVLDCTSGKINRIDRLTAANYGMPINQNLCVNKFVKVGENNIMLQAPSFFTQEDGKRWNCRNMLKIMLKMAETSLQMLKNDLSNQLKKAN